MKKSKEIRDEDIKKFNHSSIGKVQFYEIDSFNIVHNIRYFYWLEWARTLYLEMAGIPINPTTVIRDFPVMTVHNEIDYFAPCLFGMEYEVLTRISEVRNSSMFFENIIRTSDGIILAKCKAVLVHVSPKDKSTQRIPDRIRNRIKEIEKDNVKFID